MLAAKFEWPALVRFLLEKGADPCAANQFDATSLHWVSGRACLGQFAARVKRGHDNTTSPPLSPSFPSNLIQAAVSGNVETVELLLAAAKTASDPPIPTRSSLLLNKKDCFGTTALTAAGRHGRVGVVRRLLREPGVDVDAVDKDGMTAVSWWWLSFADM